MRIPSMLSSVSGASERAIAGLALGLASRLGVDRASEFGGAFARNLGPHTRNHQRALENLRLVLPGLGAERHAAILDRMWDNLGRVSAEYAHLGQLMGDPGRIRVTGLEQCRAQMRKGRGGILLSAHYGNWELSNVFGQRLGLTQANVHKPLRNPALEDLYRKCRASTIAGPLISASSRSLRQMMTLINKGVYIGMLADHKLDDGLLLPFLGIPALTNHAPAVLARRLNVPIFIGRVIREVGARFSLECRPVPVDVSADWQVDVESTTHRINDIVSGWIRERPEQWCWVHRRWKVKAAATAGVRDNIQNPDGLPPVIPGYGQLVMAASGPRMRHAAVRR